MDLNWDPESSRQWDAFVRERGGALQQAWAYGEALKRLGVRIHRAQVFSGGRVVATAQFMCRRIPGYLSLASCTRGPVWHPELEPQERREILRRLRSEIPTPQLRVTLFSPDQTAQELDRAEVSGMLRVMTGYSTAVLDLRQSVDELRAGFESKWRNRLVKAEAEKSLQVHANASVPKCRELLDREEIGRAHV